MNFDGKFLLQDERLSQRWRDIAGSYRSDEISGLFQGWIPAKYGAKGAKKVLYVGKATSGLFEKGEEDHQVAFASAGAFWTFAKQIAKSIDADVDQCIAWSNISKLSRPQIKADALLVTDVKLITDTLKAEIRASKPDIVVFVCGHFNDEVVRVVSSGLVDSDWNRSENETTDPSKKDIWWRADGQRFYLWMRHPQGSKKELRLFAVQKIRELVMP